MMFDFIRGGQILNNRIKEAREVIRVTVLYSLIFSLTVLFFFVKKNLNLSEIKLAFNYYVAELNVNANRHNKAINLNVKALKDINFNIRDIPSNSSYNSNSNYSNTYSNNSYSNTYNNNNYTNQNNNRSNQGDNYRDYNNYNSNNNNSNSNSYNNSNNSGNNNQNTNNNNQNYINNNIITDKSKIQVRSIDVVNNQRLKSNKIKVIAFVQRNINTFITIYVLSLFSVVVMFSLKGYFINQNKFLRGARIVPLRYLNKVVRRYNRKNKKKYLKPNKRNPISGIKPKYHYYKIANALYPLGNETIHTIITGASGTGKTVLITDLIDQIRKNGDRAIIYDRMGTFVSRFYNGEKIDDILLRTKNNPDIKPDRKEELYTYYNLKRDTILNPLDERAPYWSIFNEARDRIDFDNIASALIPEKAGNIDTFWNEAARTMFSSIANKMKESGNISNKELANVLLKNRLTEAAKLAMGTEAQSIIDEQNPKTALSVMAMLATNLKSLTTLRDQRVEIIEDSEITKNNKILEDNNEIKDNNGIKINKTIEENKEVETKKETEENKTIKNNKRVVKEEPFSIRKWIQNEEQEGFLFISSRADRHETLKPLISTWLDIAINSLLSLKQSTNRKIWIIIDELPSLHYLPNLQTGLAESRQFGGCFVLSMQLMAQLEAIYGQQKARATSGLCRNRVILNTPDEDTAKWCSENLGKVELKEVRESQSFGYNPMKDGVSISSQDIQRNIVLPTEIMQLNNLNAYIKFGGDFPITLSKFKYKKFQDITEGYIERNHNEVDNKNNNVNNEQTEIINKIDIATSAQTLQNSSKNKESINDSESNFKEYKKDKTTENKKINDNKITNDNKTITGNNKETNDTFNKNIIIYEEANKELIGGSGGDEATGMENSQELNPFEDLN